MKKSLTALIEREGDSYVSLCPELDIASQGDTVQEARTNLKEAIGFFLRLHLRKKLIPVCMMRCI